MSRKSNHDALPLVKGTGFIFQKHIKDSKLPFRVLIFKWFLSFLEFKVYDFILRLVNSLLAIFVVGKHVKF